MAFVQDSYDLNSSTPITVTGTESETASLTLTASDPLPLQLSGFVYETTAGGTVIPNAYITVYDNADDIVAEAYTDNSGYYAITTLSAGTYKVNAHASGYESSDMVEVTLADTPIEQSFTLQAFTPEADKVIYGVVSNSDSTPQPINGARIDLIDSTGAIVQSTLTIGDGEYVLNDLADGTYSIIISATGYSAEEINDITISDGTPISKQDVSLASYTPPTELASISGYIMNTDSAAIDNAWVGLYDESNPETLIDTTATNTDGYYIFTDVAAGNYIVRAKGEPV